MKEKYIYFYSKLLFVVLVIAFISCRKDKVHEPVVEEPTKWELIPGTYRVYDTLGDYLYDMNINYERIVTPQGDEVDDFEFVNFDNNFTFEKDQYSQPVSYFGSQLYIQLGSHDTLFDSDNNRWKIFGVFEEGYNLFHNDTIVLKFKKTNINYYLQDLVPYYECECKQIAVKQN